MKRLIYASILLLSILAPCRAEEVTESRARSVAQSFLKSKGTAITRASELSLVRKGEDNAFYIYGLPGKGFVIIAGNDGMRPVLAYSLESDFGTGPMPESVKDWLALMTGWAENAKKKNISASKEIREQWTDPGKATRADAKTVILETANWGQNNPYKNMAPVLKEGQGHAFTGCTNTAMAIVMRYHKWPEAGKGILPGYKFIADVADPLIDSIPPRQLGHKYEWDKMPLSYISGSYDSEEADAVATLMYDLGVLNKSSWGYSGTGARYDHYGLNNYFGYSAGMASMYKPFFSNSEWAELLRNEIDAGRPVLYSGHTSENGHSFVLDGYSSDGYFHFNMGWSGLSNGMYLIDPGDPNGEPLEFDIAQSAIIGVTPEHKWNGTPPPISSARFIDLDLIEAIIKKEDTFKCSYMIYSETPASFTYKTAIGYVDEKGNLTELLSEPVDIQNSEETTVTCKTPSAYTANGELAVCYLDSKGKWKIVSFRVEPLSSGKRPEKCVEVTLQPKFGVVTITAQDDALVTVLNPDGSEIFCFMKASCGFYLSKGEEYTIKVENLLGSHTLKLTR